jgi:hypothetical protein
LSNHILKFHEIEGGVGFFVMRIAQFLRISQLVRPPNP